MSPSPRTAGIHHITAIARDPRSNIAFYTGILGLRLIKKTVNFDDPTTYHFYYGDDEGQPGTILTFFPWPHMAPGRAGVGLTFETSFRAPEGSLGFWTDRFVAHGVECDAPGKRFGREVLPFRDPDGMRLSLVLTAGDDAAAPSSRGDVPAEHAIHGFDGVTLMVADAAPTGAVLTGALGFREVGREGPLVRFVSGARIGGIVDLHAAEGFLPGSMGAGSVHHVAFRAADDASQAGMARQLAGELGIGATEQKDRCYFRSIYFREPGGVIFEIATDTPGFAIDEAPEHLGEALKLPDFLEPRRSAIEAALPALA